MTQLCALIRRNVKLYFKDKGMFFTSLITPLILLVLYGTFLGNVYEDSFRSALEAAGMTVPDKLIGGCVGGELASSLLAVCCITVAFCSNFLMVQDKVGGARRDLTVSPVGRGTLALGYYIANLISTLLVCFSAVGLCLIYVSRVGWYLTAQDVLRILLDVLLLVIFGSALSSVINVFIRSQGQMSAVGTIVSAGYGFLCGAYMPISQFSEGLQKAISLLPGTYGTSLLRNHWLGGTFTEMARQGFPEQVVEAIRDSMDCNIYFFGSRVEIGTMYLVLAGAAAALIAVYVLLNLVHARRKVRT